MVTVLTVVMIGGVLVLIFVLVTRLSDQGPTMPRSITLPDGSSAQAFTQGRGWYAVVTDAVDRRELDATLRVFCDEV